MEKKPQQKNNVISILKKKTVSKTSVESEDYSKEEITLAEMFGCPKNALTVIRLTDDFLNLNESDLVFINLNLKPKSNSLVLVFVDGFADVCRYSVATRCKMEVYGVITHFARSVGE